MSLTRKVVPFRRWHLQWLYEDEVRHDVATQMAMEKDDSWTLVVNGDPVACGGTMQQWPGRYIAWMYLNSKTGPHMRFITRAVRKHLDGVKGRVEFTVVRGFEQGYKWAKMLGFEVENPPGILKAYGPLGEDHVAYVRFNAE